MTHGHGHGVVIDCEAGGGLGRGGQRGKNWENFNRINKNKKNDLKRKSAAHKWGFSVDLSFDELLVNWIKNRSQTRTKW